MYTSNYTSRDDLLVAAQQGVIINLDDISLVDSLVALHNAHRCTFPKRICFRLNPGLGRTDSETKSNELGGPNAKFGVPLAEIVNAYRAAQRCGATSFGIHMMTGSCVLNDDYWMQTVSILFEAMANIHKVTLTHINMIASSRVAVFLIGTWYHIRFRQYWWWSWYPISR